MIFFMLGVWSRKCS